MKILMISPEAPPKNSPESMQVGRFLTELEKNNDVTLITTPIERGWVVADKSLHLLLTNTKVVLLKLPFHHFLIRLIYSKYFKFLHFPDKSFWIKYKVSYIQKKLKSDFDIIYSRSMPFSSAILALRLKIKTKIPWIMHLSDPWVDSPYRNLTQKEYIAANQVERDCFNNANILSVTTEKIQEYYKKKYPEYSDKIIVTPNVMPTYSAKSISKRKNNEFLDLVYTGAFYGSRTPEPLLKSMINLNKNFPIQAAKIRLKFAGNMTNEVANMIRDSKLLNIEILGNIPYDAVCKLQKNSDILLSIEPYEDHVLLKGILLSKIVDYLSMKIPILAITPNGSLSSKICEQGFGWHIAPEQIDDLTQLLLNLLNDWQNNNHMLSKKLPEPPEKYKADICAEKLVGNMKMIINE